MCLLIWAVYTTEINLYILPVVINSKQTNVYKCVGCYGNKMDCDSWSHVTLIVEGLVLISLLLILRLYTV